MSIHPELKFEIYAAGLTLSPIANRYARAKARSEKRGVYMPARGEFYKHFITLFKKLQDLSENKGIPANEILSNLEVHAVNDKSYKHFELLTKKEHNLLHKQERDQKIQEQKDTQAKICSTCNKLKPFTEFYKDKHKPTGLYSMCKECAKARRKRIKSLKKDS